MQISKTQVMLVYSHARNLVMQSNIQSVFNDQRGPKAVDMRYKIMKQLKSLLNYHWSSKLSDDKRRNMLENV